MRQGKHATPAEAMAGEGRNTSQLDEVEQTGYLLADAYGRQAELSGKVSAAHRARQTSEEIYLRAALADVEDRIVSMRLSLAAVPADTILGAMFQTMEAITALDLLLDLVIDASKPDAGRARLEQRALNRLLYSILGVLNDTSHHKLEQIFPAWATNQHVNPWIPVENRLEDVLGRMAKNEVTA